MVRKVILTFSFVSLFLAVSYGGVHFGLIDAVKEQVKELDKKVTEHLKQTSQDQTTKGLTKLEEAYNILAAGGNYESFVSKVKEANSLFEKALKNNPDNPEANLGYAITSTILVAEDPNVKELISQTTSFIMPAPRLTVMGTGIVPTKSNASVTSFLSGGSMRAFALKAVQNPPAMSEVQKVISNVVIPIIDKAIKCLEKIENLPSFSLTLKVDNQQVEIDKGEVYILDAQIQFLKSFLCFFASYNLDVNYDDFKDTATARIAFENIVKKQGDYANFLTLKDSAKLRTSGDAFANFSSKIITGMNSIEAETDDQTDDIIRKPSSAELNDWDIIKKTFQQIYDTVQGPTTIKFTDYDPQSTFPDLKINLRAILYNPQLLDFRVFIPSGEWNFENMEEPFTPSDIDGDGTIPDWSDPTFYGMFPEMTNAKWKTYFGGI